MSAWLAVLFVLLPRDLWSELGRGERNIQGRLWCEGEPADTESEAGEAQGECYFQASIKSDN